MLLVDDETDGREMIAHLLREHGADVESVASAHEAIEAFDARPFDIILSDSEMPGEDGYSLMQRIRARQAQGPSHIPAVAVTAYGGAEDKARAMAAGFDRHIVKPIDVADVIQRSLRSADPPSLRSGSLLDLRGSLRRAGAKHQRHRPGQECQPTEPVRSVDARLR